MVGRGLALAALAAASCNYVTSGFVTNDFSGDPDPVVVDTSSGAVVLGADDGRGVRPAVLDLLSPVTLLDPGPSSSASITTEDLELLGALTPGGALDVPRARLVDQQVLTLHPCSDDSCTVGPDLTPTEFSALIGMNGFASDAVRFDLAPAQGAGTDELFILPDVAGDETTRSKACDAVLPRPFRGGGTMYVGGTEVAFTNWRIALDVCLAPDPDEQKAQSTRGADALMILSTSIAPSLLDETAYARYVQVNPAAPALDPSQLTTIDMPSGPIAGYLVTITPQPVPGQNLPVLAIAGDSTTDPRAPCRQVYANHLLAQRDCQPSDIPNNNCPCDNGKTHCTAPAVIELAPAAGLPVLVVASDYLTLPPALQTAGKNAQDMLQALRTELRPDQPEVDGILGTSALRTLELDVDYAHDRLLGRCADPTASPPTCVARPELSDDKYRASLDACLAHPVGPIR